MATNSNNNFPLPSAPPQVDTLDAIPVAIPIAIPVDLSREAIQPVAPTATVTPNSKPIQSSELIRLQNNIQRLEYNNRYLERMTSQKQHEIIALTSKIEELTEEIVWWKTRNSIKSRCLEILNLQTPPKDCRMLVAEMLKIKAAYEKYAEYLTEEEVQYKYALLQKIPYYQNELAKQIHTANRLTKKVLDGIVERIQTARPGVVLFEKDLQSLKEVVNNNILTCVDKFVSQDAVDALSDRVANIVAESKTEDLGVFSKYFNWSYANTCLQDRQTVKDAVEDVINNFENNTAKPVVCI